jgi:hypothetical protein
LTFLDDNALVNPFQKTILSSIITSRTMAKPVLKVKTVDLITTRHSIVKIEPCDHALDFELPDSLPTPSKFFKEISKNCFHQ